MLDQTTFLLTLLTIFIATALFIVFTMGFLLRGELSKRSSTPKEKSKPEPKTHPKKPIIDPADPCPRQNETYEMDDKRILLQFGFLHHKLPNSQPIPEDCLKKCSRDLIQACLEGKKPH